MRIKEKTIQIVEYEVGDIIDVSAVRFERGKKSAEYGLVIDNEEGKDDIQYWILNEKKQKMRIPQYENDKIKFYGQHVDLKLWEALCVPELTFEEQYEKEMADNE